MEYVFVGALVVIIFYVLHSPTRKKTNQATQDFIGVCAVALERTSKKEARKARILKLLSEHEEMGNEDIRETLGVSARSVVNYMNELEDEGKVRQVGEIGRSVIYRLNN